MPAHANTNQQLKEAHIAFGRSLGIWLKSQGISQQIPHNWSQERRESGIEEPAGPHNSSTSQIVRGIALPAGVGVWHAWENFNRAVAEDDVKGVASRRIRDVIKEAKPFMTYDDRVADMIDFIAMFAGRQEIREEYNPGSGFTDDEARALSEAQRKAFKDAAQAQMMSPAEAWSKLEDFCGSLDAAALAKFKKVLSGWEEWSGEELSELCPSQGESLLDGALAKLKNIN